MSCSSCGLLLPSSCTNSLFYLLKDYESYIHHESEYTSIGLCAELYRLCGAIIANLHTAINNKLPLKPIFQAINRPLIPTTLLLNQRRQSRGVCARIRSKLSYKLAEENQWLTLGGKDAKRRRARLEHGLQNCGVGLHNLTESLELWICAQEVQLACTSCAATLLLQYDKNGKFNMLIEIVKQSRMRVLYSIWSLTESNTECSALR